MLEDDLAIIILGFKCVNYRCALFKGAISTFYEPLVCCCALSVDQKSVS